MSFLTSLGDHTNERIFSAAAETFPAGETFINKAANSAVREYPALREWADGEESTVCHQPRKFSLQAEECGVIHLPNVGRSR